MFGRKKNISDSGVSKNTTLVKSSAFDGSSVAMMAIDRDFVVTQLNESTKELFQKHADAFREIWPSFNPDTMIGACIDMFHKSPAHQRKLLSDPRNLPYRTDITVGDLKISLNVSGVFDADGEYVGNILEWDDVTESRTNKGLLEAIDRTQAIIEFNLDGTVIGANENFLKTVGYRREDIIGKHHRMFMDPQETMKADYQLLWDQLAKGEAASGKFKRIKNGGAEIWLQAVYNPILDGNGTPFKVVKFATDITQAEIATAETQAKLDAVYRAQAVIEFELDGTIISANNNFLDAMGYTENEIVGRKHSMFVDPKYVASAEYNQFWDSLRNGEYREGQFQRVGKNNKDVWIFATYNPVRDPSGNVYKVVKFASDITEAHRAEQRAEAERTARMQEQNEVVTHLAGGLSALAEGDLTKRIEQPFGGDYERLRTDFNRAVEALESAIGTILSNAAAIQSGVSEISQASDDLSKRTESQAATLEETAAALDQVTTGVQQTAQGAGEANDASSRARSDAESSGEVVRQAVGAMSEIEKSSSQISQIIGVIDEIAFQTNLLALNAGVEAARAGDAGRGFAVVASEVRALAQRSSDAAKEIKGLISASSQHVGTGVDLVGRAGKALEEIVDRVTEVSGLVSSIADSAQDQARGLAEINTAVNQMDGVTQQNAAMVEESTAASHSLSEEARNLVRLVSRFKTSGVDISQQAESSRTTGTMSNGVAAQQTRAAQFAATTQGNAALAITEDDDWSEF